jgi:hypothetical protein
MSCDYQVRQIQLTTSSGSINLQVREENTQPEGDFQAVMLFFSVDRISSLLYAQRCYATLKQDRPDTPAVLVGAKCDLSVHPEVREAFGLTWRVDSYNTILYHPSLEST